MAGIFSRFIFNNAIFNTGDSPAPDAPTRGGVADYNAYRKKLKRIANAADRRLYKKAENKVERLVKEAPIEIKRQAIDIQNKIDIAALARNEAESLNALLIESIKKLDLLVTQAIMREDDDDLLLIMALS